MGGAVSKLVLYVIAIGAGIGFMMPSGRSSTSEVEAVVTRPGERVETHITRAPNGHFYVPATVNGHLVRFMVDTGASMVALTTDDAKRIGEDYSPDDFEVVGSGASGPVRGQDLRIDYVEIQGKRVSNVRAAVIEGLDVSLLGQSYLSRMRSIEIVGDEMIIR